MGDVEAPHDADFREVLAKRGSSSRDDEIRSIAMRSIDPPENDLAELLWSRIREVLERKRRLVAEAIGSYPAPIAGCDEQFNHLLEQRARVSRELARMSRAASPSVADCARLLDELVATSDLVDREDEEKLRLYTRTASP